MTATLLKSQEILKVSSNGTTVNGDAGSGIEVVIIDQGVTGTILDINVERVVLNASSSDFKYQNESNSLVIYSGSSTVATIPIQADANGTQVTFSNGTVNVFAGQSGMTFGAVPVNSGSGSSTATSITPITIDPYFTNNTGIPPVQPPPVDNPVIGTMGIEIVPMSTPIVAGVELKPAVIVLGDADVNMPNIFDWYDSDPSVTPAPTAIIVGVSGTNTGYIVNASDANKNFWVKAYYTNTQGVASIVYSPVFNVGSLGSGGGSDVTPPVWQSSTTNASGTTITLTFNEPLSATTAPPTAFVVTVAGVIRSISTILASGTDVTLTLAVPVYTDQVVYVTYTDPTVDNDTNAIQDLAGNDAASDQYSVTNISTVPVPPPDITPPVYGGASVDSQGGTISMFYTERLAETTTVPTSAFLVKANESPVNVISMHANSSFVSLTLSPGAILKGQTITVGYVAPGGSGPDVLEDLAGNPAATSPEYLAANFSTVSNPSDSTLPILMGAFGANGPIVSLTYNELLGASTVSPSAFSVTVNSAPVNVISVSPIVEGGNSFYLTLDSDILPRATATISYTDPGGADAIKDAAGNHAASFTDRTIYTG